VAAAAVLLAAGQQAFYSALFALIADVAGNGPKDHPYAVAGMVRSACFGLGGLAAAGLLSLAGQHAYRLAVMVDAVSFVLCALLLALLVRDRGRAGRPAQVAGPGRARVLADRPFLVLIVATSLAVLPGDLFLSGMSVYLLSKLHTPAWLPGTLLALLTTVNSVGATAALRVTRGLRRTTAMALGAGLYVLWCAASLAALAIPPGWRPAELLAATLLLAAAGLLFGCRANALAEAAAPGLGRGRYLAAFQYGFTVPGVIAPAVAALFSVAVWLPWLLAGLSAGLAVLVLGWLAGRLPAAALRPAAAGAGTLDRVA
jgi:Na+/melibiose symporter-like transporter